MRLAYLDKYYLVLLAITINREWYHIITAWQYNGKGRISKPAFNDEELQSL